MTRDTSQRASRRWCSVPSASYGSASISFGPPHRRQLSPIRYVASCERSFRSARISSLITMEQFETEAAQNARAVNAGLAACGAFVLLLSAIGLYGSVALGVRQRRREIGVRMALGARAEQVVGLFYTGGVRLGIIGLVLGLPMSVAASNVVDKQGAATSHALVGAVIAFVVLVVASVATLIPAARAARVNPVISLQSE